MLLKKVIFSGKFSASLSQTRKVLLWKTLNSTFRNNSTAKSCRILYDSQSIQFDKSWLGCINGKNDLYQILHSAQLLQFFITHKYNTVKNNNAQSYTINLTCVSVSNRIPSIACRWWNFYMSFFVSRVRSVTEFLTYKFFKVLLGQNRY